MMRAGLMTCALICRPSAFGLPQRLASLLIFGAEFGAVGFLCGSVGTAVVRRFVLASPLQMSKPASSERQSVRASTTLVMIEDKMAFSPQEYQRCRSPQALDLGAKWLLFMAVNGNIRHQLVRCCERTLLPLVPPGILQASMEALLHAASHVLGARQWLAFAARS
jgi:hypothetical protein